MKSYIITVNGTAYDVTVEENRDGMSVKPAVSSTEAVHQGKTVSRTAVKTAELSGAAGNIQVKAGAAGKVVKIEAGVGTQVRKGNTVVIIEAMKMEIPVVAPEDGTVATVNCKIGDSIDGGAVLATLN